MSEFEKAIQSDIEGNNITASEYYERSIVSEDYPDAYINLAVLYFQFTDYGLNASLKLPLDFIHTAFERFERVISQGISRFPRNTEMVFWKEYFQHRTIYDDLTEEDVLTILNKGEASKVPYFFLPGNLSFSNGHQTPAMPKLNASQKRDVTQK